jgi:hypothetical protein
MNHTFPNPPFPCEVRMAATIKEITRILDDHDMKYHVNDRGHVVFKMATRTYRDADGDDGLMLVINLSEDGEYFQLFAPMAYRCQGPHVQVFLQACMEIQWRTKLIQYEYDREDGEIRPKIEFPLEDALLTDRQLIRCISGICSLTDTYHETLAGALATGEIRMPPEEDPFVGAVPQTAMASMMLHSLQAEGRGEDDPLVIQLRMLLQAQQAPQGAPDAF